MTSILYIFLPYKQIYPVGCTYLADYIHKMTFHTIVGDVTFTPNGEWAKWRVLFVQYRDIKDNDIEQFRQGGKTPILYPPEYKTGDLVYPYSDIKR